MTVIQSKTCASKYEMETKCTFKSGTGNKEAREGTATFLLRHRSERSHFNIFEHCVRCYARLVHRVLSASCVVSMQRRI